MPSLPATLKRLRPANPFDTIGGAIYDFGVEREWVARPATWLMWSADFRTVYESMAAIAEVPDGGTILDVPCGGGVAFRALEPDQKVRYVAVDLAPAMLERARSVAGRRGLRQVELVEAGVDALPLEDGSVDLCLCLNGLHCFSDPAAALAEIGRCLRPGGRLVGTTVVRGRGRRHDLLIGFFQRIAGTFGPGGSVTDLDRWLADAGLGEASLEWSGAMVVFRARRPAGRSG